MAQENSTASATSDDRRPVPKGPRPYPRKEFRPRKVRKAIQNKRKTIIGGQKSTENKGISK
eukprot:5834916-Amphidinium_carterae.1